MLLITEIRFLDERKVSCASSDSGLGCEGQEREEQREETDKRIIRPDDVAVRELLNFDEVTGIMYQDEITHCLSCRKRRMSETISPDLGTPLLILCGWKWVCLLTLSFSIICSQPVPSSYSTGYNGHIDPTTQPIE